MSNDVPPPVPPDPQPRVIPWELPGVPLVSGLIDTVKLVAMSPRIAFSRVPVNPEFVRPLLYAVILGTVGALFDYIYNAAFGDLVSRFVPTGGNADADLGGLAWMQGKTIFMVVVMPLIITVTLFLGSAITHLFLMLVGGNNRGYFATFRASAYSGTANVAYLIPVCGSLIAFVWHIVLAVIGVATLHDTSTGKAALAVLLPMVLLCICLLVGVFVMGATLFGLGQG